MSKIKIQIKSVMGSVLFEYEKDNNTIKDTLIEAVKSHANLRDANLRDADLIGANLRYADLSGANLHDADLSGADLRYANLRYADLSGANLRYADLSGANLRYAYLSGANLRYANLSDADLSGADLRYANLSDANLSDAKNMQYIPLACPSDGAFVGWKKVGGHLVKLQIPEDARRSSATTNKCRCDKALVLAITDPDGSNPIDKVINHGYNQETIYKVGEMVYPDSFDEDRYNECSNGIHFFINKQDAIDYED